MDRRAPIFIPTKGRHKIGTTWKALDKMGIDRYRLIVEPQEYDDYASVVDEKKLVVLDMSLKETYNTLDTEPYSVNPRTGSGPARNMGWRIAEQEGHQYHWIVDDNIWRFNVYNNNKKFVALYDTFHEVEKFADRYENVGMAGMQYEKFISARLKHKPLTINTRIFSCNLIKTGLPIKWRGRYNEDVILSLDILKQGWCTLLFNTYLCEKATTQTTKGGNTDEIYQDGTKRKSELLKSVYPDHVELVERYGRHHHRVIYGDLKNNKLIRKI